MARARALGAAATAIAALTLASCGEKEEDLTPRTDVEATTPTTVVALQPRVVEARARDAASAKVAKVVKIRPAAWTAACSGGESGGTWTCHLSSDRCKGPVTVSPPSGPDANAITTDASGIRCAKPKRKSG